MADLMNRSTQLRDATLDYVSHLDIHSVYLLAVERCVSTYNKFRLDRSLKASWRTQLNLLALSSLKKYIYDYNKLILTANKCSRHIVFDYARHICVSLIHQVR